MRNATLQDLAAQLQDEQNRKLDIVASAGSFRSVNGHIVVAGAEPEITEDGVTSGDGVYLPTAVFDEGAAEKLGIPVAYLRKLRENHVDLYDANINGWLERDSRDFLLRLFSGTPTGVARAMLSNGFKILDNFDVLTAILKGVKDSGIKVDISQCDLYRIRTLTPPQKLEREHVLTFLGYDGNGEPQFNARPAAGTQTLPEANITHVELVQGYSPGREFKGHYVNKVIR